MLGSRLRACLAGSVAVAGLLAAPALATQVRPVNLEELTARAATIFSGSVVETSVMLDLQVGREVTVTTFTVDRLVKGQAGSTLTVKLLGGEAGVGIAGVPRFSPGEEVVLFLYGASDVGLSSPVGLGQGRFTIATDKLGRRVAVNDFGNRNLLRDLTPIARERLGASFDEWKGRQDLDADALLGMATSLSAP